MSSYSSWSVKGIDDRAREVAKEKARLKGVTLGDYINELLLQGHSEAGPRDHAGPDGQRDLPVDPDAPSLDGLAQRIEAVEARSTLAITGIDQSVLGLLSRLESTESATSDLTTNVEDMISELRQTHAALIDKVEKLETTGDNKENLDALKALERALGKLASHVYEENTLAQEETAAIKGRVESGFEELTNRMNFVEDDVSQRLKTTATKVDQALRSAASKGDPEAVMRRLTEMQTLVDNRVTGVEEDVVSALNHMEGTLVDVQERLNTAETTTDTALKALEHTFAALNKRIDDVAQAADPEQAELLRKEFETRFESLASDLRTSVEQTRETLAKEISEAAINADPQSFPALERQLTEMSGQVEAQLEALAAREDQLLSTVSEKFNTLADQVDEQLAESEKRNADAFEQVGEQVASAISRMQARHDETTARFSERLEAFGERQDQKLSEALEGVSERLTDMQERTNNAVSPVQRAIATLAARLELIEDGSAASAERPGLELPEMPAFAEEPDAQSGAEPQMDASLEMAEGPDDVDEVETSFDPVSEPEIEFSVPDEAAAEAAFEEVDEAFETEPTFSEVGEEWADEPVAESAKPEAEPEDDEAAMAMSIAARVGAMAGGGNPFAEAQEQSVSSPDSGFAAGDEVSDPSTDEEFVAGIPGLEDETAREDDAFEMDALGEEERLPTDDTEMAAWDPEHPDAEDMVFADVEPEPDGVAEEPVFEDAFDLGEDQADVAAEFSDVDEAAFDDEIENAATEDPEDIFSGWDDGRDEARESDVFEELSDQVDDPEMAFDSFEDEEVAEDEDTVSAYSEDADDEVSAPADDVLEEDDATNYLDRARNAAIRATNDKSTRFRAHQSGQGGVDRFSARAPSSRKRMPVLMAGVALMVTAAAAAGYFTLRDDLLASDTSFDIQTGPDVDEVASETATTSAALDEALGETEPVAEAAEPVVEAAAEAIDEPEPVADSTPAPVVEAAAPVLPQIDIPRAISLQQAADNGNPIAEYQMGERLIQAGDISPGVSSIRAAAENGLAIAEHRLAKLHEEGLGVPRDLGEARVWTERAAEGGNAEAMYDLGVFYAEGEGGPQSYAAAAKWFRQAAEFGVVDGQYNLALLFENGLGISPSDEEALYWYSIAARSGDGSAPADIRRVSDLLAPATVADVNARVAAWSASTPTGAANGAFGEQVWDTSQRAQLQAIQTGLNALGYDAGTPDGILGSGTQNAIRAFQADSGLTPDGRISDATVSALQARFSAGG